MKKCVTALILLLFINSCKEKGLPDLSSIEVQLISANELADNLKLQNVFYDDDRIVGYHNSVHSVSLWNKDLGLKLAFGREGQGPGEFGNISSVIAYLDGYLILDTTNRSIHRFDKLGNYTSSVYYSDRIMSISADSTGLIYAGIAEQDKVFVRISTFEKFESFKVIFAMNLNDLFESAHILHMSKGHLLFNRVFTNQTIIIDTKNQLSRTLTNRYLPEEANFTRSGPYKIPDEPVWRSNTIIEDKIFQLRNIPDSKSEIYRSDLDGNIDAMITFDHYTTSFFEMGEEVWMFSPDSLYKYAKSSFFN